jgi:CDGSH-type Zn-finger protein
MDKPIATQKSPYAVDVKEGETYYWCHCGKSAKQPFCDGSHKGSTLAPIAFTAKKTETVYLCGCRASKNGAFCDGTHKSL